MHQSSVQCYFIDLCSLSKLSLLHGDLLLPILAILYEHLYKTVLPECQRRDEKKQKAGMKSGDVSSMLGNKGNDHPHFKGKQNT